MKKIYLLVVSILTIFTSFAQRDRIVTATQTGLWSDNSTWGGSANVPNGNDSVVIPSGITVQIETSGNPTYKFQFSGTNGVGIRIAGTISLNNSSGSKTESFEFPVGSKIFVVSGGNLYFTKWETSGGNSGLNDLLKIGTVITARATSLYPVNNTSTPQQIGWIFGPQVTSAGQFTASNGAGIPLPVTFGAIKAAEKNTGVQIDWTSYSEQNLANYQIERSADGINFTSIGEVAPRNVMESTNYNFYDATPLTGTSFYRIRNNDIDGKSGLSNIVKINLNKNIKTIGVYPNPVIGNRVSFQTSDLTKGTYNVELINAFGARVFQQSVNHAGGAINQSLNLPSLQSGSYTLRINGTVISSTHKLIILQ